MADVVSLIDAEPPDRYRFDYIGMHRYYISLPVHASHKVFVESAPVMSVLDTLRESSFKHHFDVYLYCFLPDQLVLIVRGKEKKSHMKEFLATFRKASDAALAPGLGHPLWKKKYLERVLRKTEDNRRIAENVLKIPVTMGLAATPGEYEYQGSFVMVPRKDRPKSERKGNR